MNKLAIIVLFTISFPSYILAGALPAPASGTRGSGTLSYAPPPIVGGAVFTPAVTYSVRSIGVVSRGEVLTSQGAVNTVKFSAKTDNDVDILTSSPLGANEQIVISEHGYFSASSLATLAKFTVTYFGDTYRLDQFFDALYRPDLVAEAINDYQGDAMLKASSTTNIQDMVEAGPPPSVSFLTPKAGTVDTRDVVVSAAITEQRGGLGRIIWKLNGVTVGVREQNLANNVNDLRYMYAMNDTGGLTEERGIKIKPVPVKKGGSFKISKRLTLSPGKNTIEVIAYSKKGIASIPERLSLNLKDAISERPALYVLVVGVNNYRDNTLKLNFSIPDGDSLISSLKEEGLDIFSDVHVTAVYDENASVSGIKNAFEKISLEAKSNDVFILYMAGHGITVDGRYYFLPVDFRYYNEDSVRMNAVNQDHLQKWLADVPAMKTLILLDTCNSGSFVKAQASTRGIAEKTAVDKLIRATGRAVISASSDTQVALEGYKGHGVFTYSILQALKGSDANNDGVITTNEVATFVGNAVPDLTYKRWGYEQIPQMNLHGREFPISVVK